MLANNAQYNIVSIAQGWAILKVRYESSQKQKKLSGKTARFFILIDKL